jgi:hypothetical protein
VKGWQLVSNPSFVSSGKRQAHRLRWHLLHTSSMTWATVSLTALRLPAGSSKCVSSMLLAIFIVMVLRVKGEVNAGARLVATWRA